jgi:hypothetical protein
MRPIYNAYQVPEVICNQRQVSYLHSDSVRPVRFTVQCLGVSLLAERSGTHVAARHFRSDDMEHCMLQHAGKQAQQCDVRDLRRLVHGCMRILTPLALLFPALFQHTTSPEAVPACSMKRRARSVRHRCFALALVQRTSCAGRGSWGAGKMRGLRLRRHRCLGSDCCFALAQLARTQPAGSAAEDVRLERRTSCRGSWSTGSRHRRRCWCCWCWCRRRCW